MPEIGKYKSYKKKQSAFTLIELLVTIGVFSILATFISANLISPQKKTSVDSQIQTLVSDIKSQQLASMQGETGGQATGQKHGISISLSKYTLFTGNSYNPADSNNFDVALDGDLQLATTLTSSVLIFEKINGEVSGFSAGQNTITLSSPSGGQSKIITVNPYGSLSLN